VTLGFRGRVFLYLAGLVALAIAAALLALESVTSRRMEERFADRFARARSAFHELESLRLRFISERVDTLVRESPQLRTVLSTASLSADFDLGLGAPSAGADSALRDANLRLRSLLPSLALAEPGVVLVVLSSTGKLLYSGAATERVGDDLSGLGVYRAAIEGHAVDAVWVAPRSDPAPLLPERPLPAVYRIAASPVVFEGSVHGVVVSGQPVHAGILASTRSVSGLDVALIAHDQLVASTLSDAAASALAERLAALPSGASGEAPFSLELAGERYLAGRAEVAPDAGTAETSFVLLDSLAPEQGFLRRLRVSLVAAGGLVILWALVPAFALARGITRPVAELARAARRIGAGQLDTRVRLRRGDEVGELGRAFDEMAAGLEERERIRRTFERYVSREVAEEVLRHPELTRPGGARRELTVAFVDLAGFTGMAERGTPESLVALLSDYFEIVCEAVLATDGTVNEFLGDGVVAFWGAPVPQPDHAERACRAALRCRDGLSALVERWQREGRSADFRIGLHSGELVVGEIGTSERRAYRAVGDAMNVAARVESAGKSYGLRLLASEEVVARSGGAIAAREIDRVRVVGRREPLALFELVGATESLSGDEQAFLQRWSEALACYRARDFDAAEDRFAACLAERPGDAPSALYLERCRAFRSTPPDDGWDWVHELWEK
jgi:class 3 adenylate cyclase